MTDPRLLKNIQYQFDWQSYIESLYQYKLAGNGEYRINCFHCGDTKYKLYVNTDLGKFNCFKCDFRSGAYDVFDFVSLGEGLPKGKVILKLANEYARTTPSDLRSFLASAFEDDQEFELPYEIKTITGLPPACKQLGLPAKGPGWEYLIQRGFTIDEVLDLQVHFVGSGDSPIYDENNKRRGNLENRVVFPIYGGNHDLVSWQARTIDPDYAFNDKYMACPGSDLAKTVYPYVEPYDDHVVLVEGILDAVAVRRVGEPVSAYAVFGKKVSEEQIKLFQTWKVREITLFFDKKDAKKEMIKIVEELKMRFEVVNVLDMEDWPKNQDAGDCLRLPNGTNLIKDLLEKTINCYSLKYEKWKMSF